MELGLAEVLMDGRAAIGHLTEAYETLDDVASRALVAHALCRALLFTGSPAEAADFAQHVVAELPAELDEDRRKLTAFDLMTGFFGVDMPDEAVRARCPPRRPRLRRPTSAPRCSPRPAALWWAYTGGSADECCELALAALAGDDLIVGDNGLMMMAALLTLVLADRPEADTAWATAQAEAHRHGSLLGISSIHLWHGFTLLQYGELADAEESLRSGQEEFDAWGFGQVARTYTGSFIARTLVERGRLDEARTWHRARAPRAGRELGGQPLLACGPRGAAGGRGPRRRGARRVRGLRPPPRRTSSSRRRRSRARTPPARSTGSAGTTRRSRWRRPSSPTRAAGARRARSARSLRALGVLRREEGTALLEEAVTVLERSHARLELAKALADLGAALRRDRRPSDAREPLRRALELADACGADALVEHVRSELYATGARPRTTALGGVDALTASERRVAGVRRRRPEQPRHRAGAVRDAQDRRGPPQQRLPQARHPLAPRARRRARRRMKDWGRRLGVTPMASAARGSILCA